MKPVLSEQQEQDILKALDTAIAVDVWDKTKLLRVVGNRLLAIRNTFQQTITGIPTEAGSTQTVPTVMSKDPALQTPVFVSLYSATGDDLRSWERILSTLPQQIMSRPVYAKEQDAAAMVRSKLKRQNEAYICLMIDSNQLLTLPEEKLARDRKGNPLLTLKGRAIPDNYEGTFVHESGRYHYAQGKLTLI